MNLLAKIKSWLTSSKPQPGLPENPTYDEAKAAVLETVVMPQARYEASYNWWGDRSLIPAGLQDARFDATPGVRMELARKSRYWERNSAVMQRMCDLFEQYVSGASGLRMIPSTSSPDWNAKASAWWDSFCEGPEVDTGRSMAETMTLAARCWFIDGEAFILKTADANGRPKIQLIEAHRIATPTQYADLEGKEIIDGVEVDRFGAPSAFHVRKQNTANFSALGNTTWPYLSSGPEEFERIPASRMVHLFEAARPGLTRGLPFNYSVQNDLHDFEDLQLEEMKAVKSAAELSKVWHTKSGEPQDRSGFRAAARNIATQNAVGTPVIKQNIIYPEVTQGGKDQYLQIGEDVKCFASERPSVALQWFYDYLLSKICAGSGISKLLVFPYSNQGTVVRADLETQARFFVSRSTVLAKAFISVYTWAISWARDWDRAVRGAPKDFTKVLVRPPRSVNVDIGRNSAAMLAELQAGIRTRCDIWAEAGEDWKEQTEQLFIEAKFLEDMETKYGIPREKVLTLPSPPPSRPDPLKNPTANGRVNGHGHEKETSLSRC